MFGGSDPCVAHEDGRLRGALTRRAHAIQPVSIIGNALTWLVVAVVASSDRDRLQWLLWVLLQIIATASAASIYLTARPAERPPSPRLRWMLRLLPLATGSVWALGAIFWPVQRGDAGLCVLLSISGLTAGASSTWAAAPRGFLMFAVPAMLPYAWPGIDIWWLGLLTCFYLVGTTAVCFGNHRLLATSLRLHWSNEQLLEKAIEERETARALQEQAELATQSKTRFLAAASHDLRQPVQALTLFADLLHADLPATKRAEVYAALTRTAHALAAMLEGLLDLSRLDAGVTSSELRGVAIRPLLYDTAAALTDEAEELGIQLRVVSADCDVLVDPVLLARVVQNLASNAVRHGGRGAVLLSARRRESGHCLLQVWDQGRGIDDANHKRIFEEFVQLHNPERVFRKGLGLGLSMVERICKLSAWSLRLDSRPERGTVFSVRLPLAPAQPLGVQASVIGAGAGLHVMLVEDDGVVRDALADWLQERGCRVQALGNASDALERFEQARQAGEAIDVLVSDHGLPGPMVGAELVHALRARQHDLPTVVLTGAIDTPLGERPPPRSTVLQKPVSGRVLWAAIQHVVQPRRSGDSALTP